MVNWLEWFKWLESNEKIDNTSDSNYSYEKNENFDYKIDETIDTYDTFSKEKLNDKLNSLSSILKYLDEAIFLKY
jgi:hypothetical protein